MFPLFIAFCYVDTAQTIFIWNVVLPTLHSIAPGPVSELSYEENTNTSVTITWKPPKEPNGDLVAYFVEHGVYQNESTRSVEIDARRSMSTVIRALGMLLAAPHTHFYINWQACVLVINCTTIDRLHLLTR